MFFFLLVSELAITLGSLVTSQTDRHAEKCRWKDRQWETVLRIAGARVIIPSTPSVIIWQGILAGGSAARQIQAKRAQHRPNDSKRRSLIFNCSQGLVCICVLLSLSHTHSHTVKLPFGFLSRGEMGARSLTSLFSLSRSLFLETSSSVSRLFPL